MAHTVRIGISGWTYPPWRKTFYPLGLAHHRELEFASRQFDSIEINGTFYSLPKNPAVFDKYLAETPEDFTFSIKGNRFLTHIKKLNAPSEPIANFFASGVLALGPKLGPILWQFPPTMRFDAERFERFLELLPKDLKSAAKIARHHGPMMDDRARFPKPRAKNVRVRHAVEVRHESFEDPAFAKLLRRYGVALVTADSGGKFPYFEESTADFRYLRLHGPAEMYVDGYDDEALDRWAAKIKRWARRGDVFVYFDNDVKVHAPYDAAALSKRIWKGWEPAVPMDPKRVEHLTTPGPRISREDPSWRGVGGRKASAKTRAAK